ncbi:nuclear transport factor 2 family protein [Terricaulis sp.]|uniref:nuclear transport factor 2 family protein n=1 Tax=Terricaulis sp. TaxID=2768686 RepID=UPI003783A087
MDTLAQLVALEAIRKLKARYFRCVDTKDWAGLEEVFAPDIAFDRTAGMAVQNPWTGEWTPPVPDAPVIVRGRAAVMAMVRGAVEHVRTVHHGFMPEIAIESADTARGVWAMRDEIYDKSGRLIVSGSGHYHETYERLASGWVIKTSKLTRLWLAYGDGRRDP